MNPSLSSRAGTLLLICAIHLAALWLLLALGSSDTTTPPAPLPVLMAEMLPTQPVKPEVPRPAPAPEPQPRQKPQPKKAPPKPAPKTTDSKTALSEPRPAEPQPPAPAAEPPVPSSAPPSPPAPPAPPAPLTPPSFSAAYLNNPAPAYPPLLRRAGEQGRVLLRVFVSADGKAAEVRVLKSSGFALFDEAAADAVRKWRFVPARRGEEAVAEWVQVPIDFKLN